MRIRETPSLHLQPCFSLSFGRPSEENREMSVEMKKWEAMKEFNVWVGRRFSYEASFFSLLLHLLCTQTKKILAFKDEDIFLLTSTSFTRQHDVGSMLFETFLLFYFFRREKSKESKEKKKSFKMKLMIYGQRSNKFLHPDTRCEKLSFYGMKNHQSSIQQNSIQFTMIKYERFSVVCAVSQRRNDKRFFCDFSSF